MYLVIILFVVLVCVAWGAYVWENSYVEPDEAQGNECRAGRHNWGLPPMRLGPPTDHVDLWCWGCGEKERVPPGCLFVYDDELLKPMELLPECKAGNHDWVLHAHMGEDWKVFGCSRRYCHETRLKDWPDGVLKVTEDEVISRGN